MEHPMENGGLMSYLVLARKWRPKRFAELVGQEHVVRALSNALDSGQLDAIAAEVPNQQMTITPDGIGKLPFEALMREVEITDPDYCS